MNMTHSIISRPAGTPAPIIIDRADLPEVVEYGIYFFVGGAEYSSLGHHRHRECALEQLALAEFLEARERQAAEDAAAEALGEQIMQKRRDQLATGFSMGAFSYDRMPSFTQATIDRIIELQDQLEDARNVDS